MNKLSISCIDTLNYALTIRAIKATLAITPVSRVYWLSDIPFPETLSVPVDWIRIRRFNPQQHVYNHWYSEACIRTIPAVVNTDFNLIIHNDGFAVNQTAWTDEFYQYDYIGAPWLWWPNGENVGNGGFSLRSRKLYDALIDWHPSYKTEDWPDLHPRYYFKDRSGYTTLNEDNLMAGPYRHYLEPNYNIKYAPIDLAHRFSIEGSESYGSPWFKKSFGFHGAETAGHYGISLV
jgi:Protein of unknown function (DUF5672)